MGKKKDNEFTKWAKVIDSIKVKSTFYYLKSDTARANRYRYTGTFKDFKTNEVYIGFYSCKGTETENYVLNEKDFDDLFECVVV